MRSLIPVVSLSGSFREMGADFGELEKEAIHQLYEIRMEASLAYAKEEGRVYSVDQALATARECLSEVHYFDENAYEELQGIADGASMGMEELYITQGLTDFRDLLSWGATPDGLGCTSLIVSRERSQSGSVLLAQTWDLAANNKPFVRIVKRQPNQGPETISLTLTGALSMIGMNSLGLAIGTNNLKTRDARPGVHYLNVIHKSLNQQSTHNAVVTIDSAHRSGGHYYLIGDSHGSYTGLECSATRARMLPAKHGVLTHCNHPLHPDIHELAAEDLGDSSPARQGRVDSLVIDKGLLGVNEVKDILSDHHGDHLAICRHGEGCEISTNACVIMEPESGTFRACLGAGHDTSWQDFSIDLKG